MTNPSSQPLFVAQTNDGQPLGFTQPMAMDKLWEHVNRALLLSRVHLLVPTESGFAYQAVGRFVLQFVPDSETVQPPSPSLPPETRASQLGKARVECHFCGALTGLRADGEYAVCDQCVPAPAPKAKKKVKARPVKKAKVDPQIEPIKGPKVPTQGGELQSTGFKPAQPGAAVDEDGLPLSNLRGDWD